MTVSWQHGWNDSSGPLTLVTNIGTIVFQQVAARVCIGVRDFSAGDSVDEAMMSGVTEAAQAEPRPGREWCQLDGKWIGITVTHHRPGFELGAAVATSTASAVEIGDQATERVWIRGKRPSSGSERRFTTVNSTEANRVHIMPAKIWKEETASVTRTQIMSRTKSKALHLSVNRFLGTTTRSSLQVLVYIFVNDPATLALFLLKSFLDVHKVILTTSWLVMPVVFYNQVTHSRFW